MTTVCKLCTNVETRISFSLPVEQADSGSGEVVCRELDGVALRRWRLLSWGGPVKLAPSSEAVLSERDYCTGNLQLQRWNVVLNFLLKQYFRMEVIFNYDEMLRQSTPLS